MKKLNYLFFIIPVLFFLLSISTKASSQITLPTTYIQVGVGNDEMLEEENLTYISGFVNFQVEGTYLVTYTDRQNNIYKKQFVIIPEDDNQYLLTIEKEHMINSPNTEEIVDVFYITDYNYYVVSNYQQEDPTAPDQEKICITYYENNTYKWEYRYYKYSRYVKGILKEKNLIITGLVYNENNDYINTIVLLEITKDRQIIKTREIQSSDSCYIYGIHYFENNI